MVEKNMNVCEVCGSGNGYCRECGHMCGWRGNNILRWVLGILIITWVFSLGMKFGQMSAYLEQYGYSHGGNMYYRSMPMMNAGWTGVGPTNFTVSTQALPVNAETGVVKVIKSN